MKKTLIAAALLLAAGSVFAQQQGTIDFKEETCFPGGEMPLIKVVTHDEGTLRAYFRKVGTADWCSVDGMNEHGLSNIILPKFEMGEEIEYYFIVLQGDRVMAKSPKLYRSKAIDHCESPVARHTMLLTLQCLPPVQNPMASSLAAGYAAKSNTPHNVSPEQPTSTNSKQ